MIVFHFQASFSNKSMCRLQCFEFDLCANETEGNTRDAAVPSPGQ